MLRTQAQTRDLKGIGKFNLLYRIIKQLHLNCNLIENTQNFLYAIIEVPVSTMHVPSEVNALAMFHPKSFPKLQEFKINKIKDPSSYVCMFFIHEKVFNAR